MKKYKIIFLFLSVIGWMVTNWSAQALKPNTIIHSFRCPSSVNIEMQGHQIANGWEIGHPAEGKASMGTVYWRGVGFSNVNGGDHGDLVPDFYRKGVNPTSTWLMNRSKNSNPPYWIICEYTDTAMTLVKKIPDNVHSCTAYYANKLDWVPHDVICKTYR